MKIGIQFAMPSELNIVSEIKDMAPSQVIAGASFYELSPNIVVCIGGVGKVNAAMSAQILCTVYHVDMILNPGVAGTFADLPIGAIVLAEDLIQHDVDTTAVGDPIGLVSTVNMVSFPAWEVQKCKAMLEELGFEASAGRIASGDWFSTKCERSLWIRDTFQPLLIEMEGCAIAQVCYRNNVKFAALKTVSDHTLGEANEKEYSDYGFALQQLGKVVMPFAKKLSEM